MREEKCKYCGHMTAISIIPARRQITFAEAREPMNSYGYIKRCEHECLAGSIGSCGVHKELAPEKFQ